jgi:membrane-bound serine protease (ClpP class)
VDSTEAIYKKFLSSKVPVAVFVYPSGGKAASAGAIITLAAHIAAMAPATTIGSAHPVGGGSEQQGSTMEEKVTNWLAATARAMAKERGRDEKWAEEVVTKSKNSTADEALQHHAIDLIAADLPDLLAKLDGRTVKVAEGVTVTLHPKNAPIEEVPMSFTRDIMKVIGNPSLAYILLMIGILGVIYELSNPGAIFPGVIGGICLIFSLFSLRVLPVNYAAIFLILLAIILFVVDIKVPSHGILSVGAVVSLLLGSLMLIDSSKIAAPDLSSPEIQKLFRIPWAVILTVTGTTAAFFIFAVQAGIRAQRGRVTTGYQGLVGAAGIAKTEITPTHGTVVADGAYWSAKTDGETIKQGQAVEVVSVERFTLIVKGRGNKNV